MRIDQAMPTPELMAAAYRAEMRRLLDAVERIPGERLDVPVHGDWTIKEVLVHLAGWDRAVTASADDVRAGQPARLIAMRLADVNEDVVESRRSASLEETLADLADAHQGLLRRLEGVTPEQWSAAVPGEQWRDGSPMTLASVFAYRYHDLTHYGGHAEKLEAWLREAERPESPSTSGPAS